MRGRSRRNRENIMLTSHRSNRKHLLQVAACDSNRSSRQCRRHGRPILRGGRAVWMGADLYRVRGAIGLLPQQVQVAPVSRLVNSSPVQGRDVKHPCHRTMGRRLPVDGSADPRICRGSLPARPYTHLECQSVRLFNSGNESPCRESHRSWEPGAAAQGVANDSREFWRTPAPRNL